MTATPSSYAARLIRLYLEQPDTPLQPSPADWHVARELDRSGVPLDVMRLAMRIAFVRRRLSANSPNLPPIRSLAYYRTVAASLSAAERTPEYAGYVERLFEQLRSDDHPAPTLASENRAR